MCAPPSARIPVLFFGELLGIAVELLLALRTAEIVCPTPVFTFILYLLEVNLADEVSTLLKRLG